jgi:hypothetical protein
MKKFIFFRADQAFHGNNTALADLFGYGQIHRRGDPDDKNNG